MPADTVIGQARPVTRSELESDLRSLGVQAGGILMVHTRMSAIGWVIGGGGRVGDAESYLFQARPLVEFAVEWLHANFAG